MRIFRTLAITLIMATPIMGQAALIDTSDVGPRDTQNLSFGQYPIELTEPDKDALFVHDETMRLLSDPEKFNWDTQSAVIPVSGRATPPVIDFRGQIPGFVFNRLPPQARPSSDRTPVIVFLPAPVLLLATALASLGVFARRHGESRRLPRAYLRQGLETFYRRRVV